MLNNLPGDEYSEVSFISWWPRVGAWYASGLDFGCWTPYCEEWFQRQLTAVWLSLAAMLVIQLNPPSLVPKTFKSEPSPEASAVALNVLQVLLQTSLNAFSQPGVMVAVCLAC